MMRNLSIPAFKIPVVESLKPFLSRLFPSMPDSAFQNPRLTFQVPNVQLMGGSLVVNILSLALPVLTLQVYDRLLISQNIGTLQVLAMGIVVVVVLETVLRLCRAYITAWSGAAYEHAVSCNAMRHILASDLVSLHKDGVGAHLQRMNGVGRLQVWRS